jgi:uncharacterized protein (DUF433 family)
MASDIPAYRSLATQGRVCFGKFTTRPRSSEVPYMTPAARTTYEHVCLSEDGTPTIAFSNTKVVELVGELYAYGWGPAEMQFQHPHLSLGQIHSALDYYYDHREELDADLYRRFEAGEELRRTTPVPAVVAKLRLLKH